MEKIGQLHLKECVVATEKYDFYPGARFDILCPLS